MVFSWFLSNKFVLFTSIFLSFVLVCPPAVSALFGGTLFLFFALFPLPGFFSLFSSFFFHFRTDYTAQRPTERRMDSRKDNRLDMAKEQRLMTNRTGRLSQSYSGRTDMVKDAVTVDGEAARRGSAEKAAGGEAVRGGGEKERQVGRTGELVDGGRRENGGEANRAADGDGARGRGTSAMAERERDATAEQRRRSTDTLTTAVAAPQRPGGQYRKEMTVHCELKGEVTTAALLRGIKMVCGEVVACRMLGGRRYEVTMSGMRGKEKLMEGFKIGDVEVLGRELVTDEMVVSFLNLPVYISDTEIESKLLGWGVSAASPIKRRMWPGTQVADGTRYLKVKFTSTIQSLPYSARFETAMGLEHFRVIHDRQVRVCRLCIQPGHILRDCPEFRCFKCQMQGHYAKECDFRGRRGEKCDSCGERGDACECEQGHSQQNIQPTISTPDSEEEGGEDMEEAREGVTSEDESNEEDGERQPTDTQGTGLSNVPDTQLSEAGLGSSLDGISNVLQPTCGQKGEGGMGTPESSVPLDPHRDKSKAVCFISPGSTGSVDVADLSRTSSDVMCSPPGELFGSPGEVEPLDEASSMPCPSDDSEMDFSIVKSARKRNTKSLTRDKRKKTMKS